MMFDEFAVSVRYPMAAESDNVVPLSLTNLQSTETNADHSTGSVTATNLIYCPSPSTKATSSPAHSFMSAIVSPHARVVTCDAIDSNRSRSLSSSPNHIWNECAGPGLGYWRSVAYPGFPHGGVRTFWGAPGTPLQKLKTHRIWSTIFWAGPQIQNKK